MSQLEGFKRGTPPAGSDAPWTADRSVRYKLFSLLLQYPSLERSRNQEAITALVREMPSGEVTTVLEGFLAFWRAEGLLALQQEYVRAFDFQKRVSLHLSYYRYGDQRHRGLALLRLKRAFAAAGLPLHDGEMPDYLPALLEFAALAPEGYGEVLLQEQRAAIELLRLGLKEDSPYKLLVDGLCCIVPQLTREDREAVRALVISGPPSEQVGLEPFAPPEVMPESVSGSKR